MTNEKELHNLIEAIQAKGAVVNVKYDAAGYIFSVQISGIKGIGPGAMGPIAAAEAMRRALVC